MSYVLRWLGGDENDADDAIGVELLEFLGPREGGGRIPELVAGVVQHGSIETDHVGHSEPPVGVVSEYPVPAEGVK